MTTSNQYAVEDFFRDPAAAGATISPDGARVAYSAPAHGRLNIWVEDLESGERVCVTHDTNRGVRNHAWTRDPRFMLYLQDDDGDENWHLHRIDLDHPETHAVDLTPFPGVAVLGHQLLANDADHVLVVMNHRDPEELDVHRVHLATGALELLVRNPGNVARWQLSPSGAVFAFTTDAEVETLHRWDAEGGLVPLMTRSSTDNPSCGPWSVTTALATPSGDGVWLASNRDTEQTQLVHVSATDGTQTLIAKHDELSVDAITGTPLPSPLIVSPATGDLAAVRYLGERQHIEVLDEAFGEVLAALSQLSDGEVGHLSCDRSGTRWVVSFTHDRDPDVTWLYDHATGESRLLFRPWPDLDPTRLAPMEPVALSARDGLPLHGYLTLPQGVEPVGLPLVLFVHGGPWMRDRWGYNARVQVLADAGYAVLQVNFRGSNGYGRSHLRAALREFAGTMHDDLVDAVGWAVAEGIAHPDRVAIFGGSYGGYSALVGATFTPEVFAAAIDYCGISDLEAFVRAVPAYWRKFSDSTWGAYVGNPDDPEQAADMRARSPITRLDAITKPLLVIHGARDVRVLQSESDLVVDALRERGADVEYLLKDNEGHGFLNPENNVELFETIIRFLDRTIGHARSRAA